MATTTARGKVLHDSIAKMLEAANAPSPRVARIAAESDPWQLQEKGLLSAAGHILPTVSARVLTNVVRRATEALPQTANLINTAFNDPHFTPRVEQCRSQDSVGDSDGGATLPKV